MTMAEMVHMPLARAWLCGDCDSIGNCAEHCPACAEGSLVAMITLINRDPVAERQNTALEDHR